MLIKKTQVVTLYSRAFHGYFNCCPNKDDVQNKVLNKTPEHCVKLVQGLQ